MEESQEQVVVITLGERDAAVLVFRDGSRVRLRCVGPRADGVSLWTEMPCVDPSGRTSFLSEVDVAELALAADDEGVDVDMGEHGTVHVDLVATAPPNWATLAFQLDPGCSVNVRRPE